jgi:hypothetical protein
MLAISGYRACGKSEAAAQMAEMGFKIYDGGPALRAATQTYNRQTGSELCAEEYVHWQTERTGDPDWAVKFDVRNIMASVHRYGPDRNVLVGCRNYDELQRFGDLLQDEVGYEIPMHLILMRSTFKSALRNFRVREALPLAEASRRLMAQHERERVWGVPVLEQNAHLIIENEGTGDEGRLALRRTLALALMEWGYFANEDEGAVA